MLNTLDLHFRIKSAQCIISLPVRRKISFLFTVILFCLEVDFGNHVFFQRQSEHVFLNVYTIDLYSNVHIHHMPVMC